MMERLLELRLGGGVKRFHTWPMLNENLVSSHSWGVAVLVLEIQPEARRELLVAALYHDLAEFSTGDVPATTKWEFPSLKLALKEVEKGVEKRLGIETTLTPYEKEILKCADMSDLVLTGIMEAQMGNTYGLEVMKNGLDWLVDNMTTPETIGFVAELVNYAQGVIGDC